VYGLDAVKCGCRTSKIQVSQEELKLVEERIHSYDGFKYTWSKSDFYTHGDVPDKLNGYNITDWNDPANYRTRWLVGLPDLNDYSENVKKNRRVFMDELAILGFAGIRIDAVKHMQPQAVFDLTKQFVNSATGDVFKNERHLPPFPTSDIVIICESLSNGSDYDLTYGHYMNALRTLSIPEANILFYDNINYYKLKDHMANLNNFDVSASLNNPNLKQNALNYICNHDIAHNFSSNSDYICNGFVKTLFYCLMILIHKQNVMVYNDDEPAYRTNPEFPKDVADTRLKSDNFLNEYKNTALGQIIHFQKVIDQRGDVSIQKFKHGPNIIFTFSDLGFFVFSFTGCLFDASALKSMNLTNYNKHIDSFTGKAIEGFQLKPYHSALFCKGTITPPPPPPPTNPINGAHNFQIDLEIDISAKTPKLTVKHIELTS
jgi:glycosidase